MLNYRLCFIGLFCLLMASAHAQGNMETRSSDGIDFGQDNGVWVFDGECDDPRFEGEGMAELLDEVDIGSDASDCRAAYEEGRITLKSGIRSASVNTTSNSSADNIDFGDDSSIWAHDGECDDPRFEGEGMAQLLDDADIKTDASDCRTAFAAGTIRQKTHKNARQPAVETISYDGIDFGSDTGLWANDGECDDPRFQGRDMADELLEEDRYADASDCLKAYKAGLISLRDLTIKAAPADGKIDFGDDSGIWSGDGECDDPRFQGEGMASELVRADVKSDATDCEAAFASGRIKWNENWKAEFAADD